MRTSTAPLRLIMSIDRWTRVLAARRVSSGDKDAPGHVPIPRLRQLRWTLSIAMYPRLRGLWSLCRLCLHTITPTSSFEPSGYA